MKWYTIWRIWTQLFHLKVIFLWCCFLACGWTYIIMMTEGSWETPGLWHLNFWWQKLGTLVSSSRTTLVRGVWTSMLLAPEAYLHTVLSYSTSHTSDKDSFIMHMSWKKSPAPAEDFHGMSILVLRIILWPFHRLVWILWPSIEDAYVGHTWPVVMISQWVISQPGCDSIISVTYE